MAARKTKTTTPPGRYDPSEKYDELVAPHLDEISALVGAGYSLQIVAGLHGVSENVFRKYMEVHPELSIAVNDGRRKAISEIVAAMHKRARGYEYQERTVIMQQDPNTKRVLRQDVKQVTKEVAPDPQAGKWLLEKYDPEQWGTTNGKMTRMLFKLREENGWNAIRTAQEFESNGLTVPKTLEMEVKMELETSGTGEQTPPKLEVILGNGEVIDLANVDD